MNKIARFPKKDSAYKTKIALRLDIQSWGNRRRSSPGSSREGGLCQAGGDAAYRPAAGHPTAIPTQRPHRTRKTTLSAWNLRMRGVENTTKEETPIRDQPRDQRLPLSVSSCLGYATLLKDIERIPDRGCDHQSDHAGRAWIHSVFHGEIERRSFPRAVMKTLVVCCPYSKTRCDFWPSLTKTTRTISSSSTSISSGNERPRGLWLRPAMLRLPADCGATRGQAWW